MVNYSYKRNWWCSKRVVKQWQCVREMVGQQQKYEGGFSGGLVQGDNRVIENTYKYLCKSCKKIITEWSKEGNDHVLQVKIKLRCRQNIAVFLYRTKKRKYGCELNYKVQVFPALLVNHYQYLHVHHCMYLPSL